VSSSNDIRTLSVGAATVARVDATRSWRRCTFDAAGEGWFRLADKLADPAGLDAWYQAEVDGTGHGHRDLAGALIVYRFAGSLAELVVGPLLEQRRAVLLTPENLSLLLGERARIEALSVGSPEVAVLRSDPDVERAGVRVVADEAALRSVAVEGMLAVFGPLAEAVRERAPFGLRGMWGTLADHLSDVSLRRARDRKSDREAAWQLASALIDELAERQPLLRARPSRHLVTHEDRSALFSTKGTCCLIYKTNMPVVEGRGGGRGERDTTPCIAADACTSCPLRSLDDRESRLVRYLMG
jgi:hypothetical protein